MFYFTCDRCLKPMTDGLETGDINPRHISGTCVMHIRCKFRLVAWRGSEHSIISHEVPRTWLKLWLLRTFSSASNAIIVKTAAAYVVHIHVSALLSAMFVFMQKFMQKFSSQTHMERKRKIQRGIDLHMLPVSGQSWAFYHGPYNPSATRSFSRPATRYRSPNAVHWLAVHIATTDRIRGRA